MDRQADDIGGGQVWTGAVRLWRVAAEAGAIMLAATMPDDSQQRRSG